MKKTLILLTIISSVATFSKTNGFVEAYNENEANFKKNTDATFTAKELGVKTQVNVARTNLSFGGDFKFKDLQLNNTTPKNFLNHSSVWIKYDLSKKETGINSYVKATIKPKFHAEEAGKEMAQVSKLKEEIHQLESKKAELTLAKEKADKDVKEKIKDIDKVKQLNNEIKENNKKIPQKRKDKEPLLTQKKEKEKFIKEYQTKLNNLPKTSKNYDATKQSVEQQLSNARDQLKKIENKLEKIDDEIKELRNQNKKNSEVVKNENKKIAKYGPKAKALVEALEKAKKDITDNEATINEKTADKNEIEVYKDNGGIDLEGDLSYKTEGAVFGVNSVLNVPFSNTYIKGNSEITKDFATLIKSTHTAYFGVLDVLSGGLSVQHSYKGEDAMKYVSAKLDGKYAVSNDLDLVGKFRFKYQFNGEIDFKNEYLGNKDLLSLVNPKWNVLPLTYIHMYSLGLNYRNTLNITGFVGHGYEKASKLWCNGRC